MTAVTLARLSDVTSAILGAHGCRGTRSSGNVSVGNNTYTVIGFTAEDYDTDSIHEGVTNPSRLTIPTLTGVTTGLWAIKASGYTDASSGRVDVMIRKGSNTNPASGTGLGAVLLPASSSGVSGYMIALDYVFTAADYIECFVRTSGGSFSVIFDGAASPFFEIAFLGKVT